jgi:UDP-3-O-[3-hydroxymyristoyl] glucosamine N-acyltransferase
MFTQNTIKSSTIERDLDVEIHTHFEFSFCGKIGLTLAQMLVYVENKNFLEKAYKQKNVVGVVCPPELVNYVPAGVGIIVSSDPRACLNKIQSFIASKEGFQWEGFKTNISKSAKIHKTAVISEKNVIINDDVQIGPNSVVYPRTVIEAGCQIGANSTVGCEGMQINIENGDLKRINQSGGVILRAGCTLLSNVCVVRATYGGFTQIGKNSMLDNLVHIAHDVSIGANVIVLACAEISGRVTIGRNSKIGMNATILNGLSIGKNCDVSLGAVVVQDVLDDEKVTGNFAIPHHQFRRNLIRSKK